MKRAIAVGALLGALIGSSRLGLWSELRSRLSWSLAGGGGERADWSEPAFLMLVAAVPAALAGGAIAALATHLVQRLRRKQPNAS
jgi:hypothetical protein